MLLSAEGHSGSASHLAAMAFTPEVRKRLADVFARPVLTTLERRTVLEPWDEAAEIKSRPFHHALVPAAVWKGSKFERSFTTSLGSTWEAAAVVLGTGLRGWGGEGLLLRRRDPHDATAHDPENPQRPRSEEATARLADRDRRGSRSGRRINRAVQRHRRCRRRNLA